MSKATARIVLALAVAAAALATLGAASPSAADRASYIVVLKSSVANPAAVAQEHATRFDGTVTHVYSHALKGYSLTLPSAAVARLAADPRVDYVEADVPETCPQCGGQMLRRCPSCEAPFSSAFAVECERCGTPLRDPNLFGTPIRRA